MEIKKRTRNRKEYHHRYQMIPMYSPQITCNCSKYLYYISYIVLLILVMGIGNNGIANAASDWQKVQSPDWAEIEIPSGWTIMDDLKMGDENKTAMFSARSPDWQSELFFILDRDKPDMTIEQMQAFQDQWMQNAGYRICKTKDPVKRIKSDNISLKQVYVQGTDKGAVMYSASYPGIGTYHAALVMSGESAVRQYYDSIPPQIPDHIRLVIEKNEIGTIIFSNHSSQ